MLRNKFPRIVHSFRDLILMIGNLVLDQPAAQRMILHSVPRDSITRNPSKANEDPLPITKLENGKKRAAETQKMPPKKKKSKTKKCTYSYCQG
jgi:hypothetical protein